MPITWYVNLDADPGNHRGPEIPVKVTRSIVTSFDANRSVTWTCAPGQDNLNTVAADASWKQGNAPATQTSTVAEQGTTRAFHNCLKLPVYGGERYTITAQRSDKTGPSLTDQVEVKRRLYYVLNWMNDEGKKLFEVVKPIVERIFAEVGIELKKVGGAAIPDRTAVRDLAPLVAGRPALPTQKKGLIMRLALIRLAVKEIEQSTTLPLVDQHGVDQVGADTVEWANGAWQLTVHLPPEPNLAAHRRLRLGAAPEVTVKVAQCHNLTHEVRTTWMDSDSLPCDVVRVDERTVRVRIRDGAKNNNDKLNQLADIYRQARLDGDFPATHFSGTPNGPELAIEVKVKALRPLGGSSRGPNIALTQDMSMYYPHGTRQTNGEALARVFAHEIAHSIGMVLKKQTYNGAQHTHGQWYDDDNGGQGKHCHHNASLVDNTPQDAGDFYYPDNPNCDEVYTPDNGNICIMFHQRTAHLHGMSFCDECKEFMRAQDLSRTKLKTLHWDQVF